ncbi:MAG: Rieske (2Fe-2S) protein [Propionicimonas sp.]
MTATEPTFTASRRALLAATGAGALALCLGGCATGGGGAPTGNDGGSGEEGTTVPVADVPVGSGVIVGAYVVTQPTEGSFEAFSSRCTHQGLPVQQVTDAAIVCGHHGSSFSLADGSVITGPATQALTAVTVTQDGDTLTVG